MSKFDIARARAAGRGPVTASVQPGAVTYEGAPGYVRDAKSELFLLAVVNMAGEETFYEAAGERDSRFASLAQQVAVEDPSWLGRFLPWLRGEANMRSASLAGAAEAARGRVDAGEAGGSRRMVASVLQRAEAFSRRVGEVGHGTRIGESVRAAYAGHDRVVIVTDMQAFGPGRPWGAPYVPVSSAVPPEVPVYGFNMQGYKVTGIEAGSPNRHELGGLSDAAFRMIPLAEGADAGWPWEQPARPGR